jgi:hypothetical protein
MAASASRRAVLSLYAACLRSAKRCPEPEKAREMALYTRLRFDSRRTAETRLIPRLLE